MDCYVIWLKGSKRRSCGVGRGRKVCGRVREWSIGVLQIDHPSEADLGDEIVVEEKVGGGRDGEENRRCAEEEDGTQVCF